MTEPLNIVAYFIIAQNYLHLKLLNLLNVFKENQFISIEEIIQNIIMKQTNEKKVSVLLNILVI